ncbi:MBL fold metallo-hydrolase [Limimaricola pyoseonensis]|uniref:Glyoxylase, beta-lactamase superfamily II n=1 Tax=Limimaricola pyoseonensis TaxID=521013 RepID=A0A1G7G4I5_9RHOB|nr:MBL fold metallo-hydrolase [Limimaricola pyoseonensis]SDE83042.1 Glyoxylase, beta-lactamase superfamily II [Limimaricola pyoseonensis]
MSHSISRRAALAAGAALPLAAATTQIATPARAESHAAAAARDVPMPTHRVFRMGQTRVTTLLAASRVVPDPQSIFGLNVETETFAQVSRENFIPADRARFFFNPVLIEAGENKILVDTGTDAAGMTAALESAGHAPGDITHVVITHMHPDHIGGLMTEAGEKTFPNASLHAGQVEFDYWSQNPSDAYEANVRPLEGELNFLAEGDEVGPLTTMEAFGHTPGHLCFTLAGGERRLLLMADLANHYVWSVGYPDWNVSFDMDKQMATKSRRRVLTMAAESRMPVIGYHMPFPGMGFVQKRGEDGFRWVQQSYQLTM